MNKIKVSEIRVSEIKVSEIRVSEISVNEIRISSNHRKLHGAIFLNSADRGKFEEHKLLFLSDPTANFGEHQITVPCKKAENHPQKFVQDKSVSCGWSEGRVPVENSTRFAPTSQLPQCSKSAEQNLT